LPLGQQLERKVKKAVVEQFIEGEDERPRCPFCSGDQIQRKGILPCGTQRWHCRDCVKRFVSKAHRHATLDRRKHSHFDSERPDDAKEEATSLFELALHESNVDEIRAEIQVSALEQRIAEFFTARGVVSQALAFRDEVLTEFDRLAEEKRKLDFNNLVAGTANPAVANYASADNAQEVADSDPQEIVHA
jgi:ribosomal protein L37AE/L43A